MRGAADPRWRSAVGMLQAIRGGLRMSARSASVIGGGGLVIFFPQKHTNIMISECEERDVFMLGETPTSMNHPQR
jgi:hypothetical protein